MKQPRVLKNTFFETDSIFQINDVDFGLCPDTEISHVNSTETQKKFIPVESTSNIESPRLPESTRNLIVVASLIDRAPNLGGLTRTCEIFAVSQLVVNNLDITRNKEFTSLSITAEKHVDLVEVRVYVFDCFCEEEKKIKINFILISLR